jgi:hypothetical protein
VQPLKCNAPRAPIDTSTGLQAGSVPHSDLVPVLKGWLVTLPGGHECLMKLDKARADNYAAQQHGTIEPLFVFRAAP